MPFSVTSVAFVFDDIEEDGLFVLAGVNHLSVSGLDLDVKTLVTVLISMSVLVEAVVGDVLSDFQAVESHVSEGDSIGVVSDLFTVFQVVDQESPFIDEVHFRDERSLLWSNASFGFFRCVDAVNFKFVFLCSHVRVDVVWTRFDIRMAQFEVLAVLAGEFLATIWFLRSHYESRDIDELGVDGTFGVFLLHIKRVSFFALIVSVTITEHWCFDVGRNWREDG